MVDIRFESRCATSTQPRIPDQVQPRGQHFFSQRAALLSGSASKLDDLYVVPRSQPADEPANVARDPALRLAKVRRVYDRGENCAAVIAAPAHRKKT